MRTGGAPAEPVTVKVGCEAMTSALLQAVAARSSGRHQLCDLTRTEKLLVRVSRRNAGTYYSQERVSFEFLWEPCGYRAFGSTPLRRIRTTSAFGVPMERGASKWATLAPAGEAALPPRTVRLDAGPA
jgi:hypothetical protein